MNNYDPTRRGGRDAGERTRFYHQAPTPAGNQYSVALPHGGRVITEARRAGAGAGYRHPFNIKARYSAEDETYQVNVHNGVVKPQGNNRIYPSTFDGETWPGSGSKWIDLPTQPGNNYIHLEVQWLQSRCALPNLEISDEGGVIADIPALIFSVTSATLEFATTATEGYTEDGSGYFTEKILLGKVHVGTAGATITQETFENVYLAPPVVYAADDGNYYLVDSVTPA